MPVIRNKLSSTIAGGPRQYTELQDRLMVSTQTREELQEARSELSEIGLRTKPLRSVPVAIAEPETNIEDVLDRARQLGEDNRQIRNGIREIANSDESSEEVLDTTQSILAATGNLIQQVRLVSVIDIAEFVKTEADFGPENLRMDIQDQPSLTETEAKQKDGTIEDVYDDLGVSDAWEETRGENAICAIFDTGFAEDLIAPGRIRATYHGGGTESAFESAEGHGTMCAGAAVANSDEGVPFDGVAPDAEVILVRITDNKGQIRSDIISEAWDWIANLDTNKPIVLNHSYGTPLCSGRPRSKHCNTTLNQVIAEVAADPAITPVYAAGNEAMRCGHRPSGVTSAITGTNSLSDVITVGALLTNGREAQRYSSHGRGDCAPIADPKPNVSCRLPMYTYYGTADGWKIKDMSTGIVGSGGGTSHASPTTAGMITLMQSKAVSNGGNNQTSGLGTEGRDRMLDTEEIKRIIHDTAEPPHRTQVNSFGFLVSEKGYDARFGHGEMRIAEALSRV